MLVSALFRSTKPNATHAMQRLFALLVIIAASLAIQQAKAANPPRLVKLTLEAQVSVPSGDPLGSFARLYMAGQLVDSTGVDAEGRFTLDIPADMVATLEVGKPGHQVKHIAIDTHHLRAFPRGFSLDTVMEAEVRLEEGQQQPHTEAGRIAFNAEDGTLSVRP